MNNAYIESNDSTEYTINHIKDVLKYMKFFAEHVVLRALLHDASKLLSPEKEIFDRLAGKRKAKYMSKEYLENLEILKPALEHHYKNNSHHVQYYNDGINGMTLIDLLEHLCDTIAVSNVDNDGDVIDSINKTHDRQFYDKDGLIKQILINTYNQYIKNKNNDSTQ
ncbi:MAG: DUF5662 family protein [Syntrophothermus sp.]